MRSLQRCTSLRLTARCSKDAPTNFYYLAQVEFCSNFLRFTACAVKQHLFTSWRILSSGPILLNQGNKDYSSSTTSAIKILVSARLHCRRCYGATYRISSSEHGIFGRILLHIRESEFEHSDRKSHHQLPALIFRPREKSDHNERVGRGTSSHFLFSLTAASQPCTTSLRSHHPPTASSRALHCRHSSQQLSLSP
jgi:hypothetical protein